MGVQIKLVGVNFDNPGLPVLPPFGFTDSFNRPDATTLGNDWSVNAGSGVAVQGIAGNAAFFARTSTAGPAFASRESNLSDVTVEAKVAVIDGNTAGLALRAESITNYIRFTASSNTYRLEKIVDNTTSVVWVSASGMAAAGDVLKAVLRGPSIALYANGVLLTTQNVPELVGNTRHGLYNNGGPNVRFDYCNAVI